MSGTANPLQYPQQAMPSAAPSAPVAAPPAPSPVNQALASSVMRGRTAQQMVRRRDAAGAEMEMLAKVMNDPNPTSKEVEGYIHDLVRKDHVPAHEAAQILATMPSDPEALRGWARAVFQMVMHEGIHAHAAFPKQIYPSQDDAPQGDTTSPPPAPQGAQP